MRSTVLRTTVTALMTIAALSPGAAVAAEVTYDLGLASAYVWRGLTFTDGAVFQPAVTTSHESGVSLNVWGNLDIDDVNDLDGEFQEVDLTLAYGFGDGPVSYEVGFIEYLFPNGVGDGTREVYFSLGYDAVISPSFTIYYDFDEVEDFFATVGVDYGAELSDDWSLGFSLLAGYAGEDFAGAYGGMDGGLFNGEVSASLDYTFDRGSVSIFATYSDSLDDDVLVEQPVDLWGGVSLSMSF